jgi:hypothetical protein
MMGGYNPDYHGYPSDHKPDCHLLVHGGEGKNCDCGYLKKEDDTDDGKT